MNLVVRNKGKLFFIGRTIVERCSTKVRSGLDFWYKIGIVLPERCIEFERGGKMFVTIYRNNTPEADKLVRDLENFGHVVHSVPTGGVLPVALWGSGNSASGYKEIRFNLIPKDDG